MSIYNVLSDFDNTTKLSQSLRNRKLDQSLLYQKKGAKLYYKAIENEGSIILDGKKTLGLNNIYNFANKNVFNKGKITLISLGCGKSYIEKHLFEKYKFSDIDYLGVDSSNEMLKLSEKELEKTDIEYNLLCADFSLDNFSYIIKNYLEIEKKRLFCFFSNTFGNISHTNIVDILYNILKKGEQIWLDVRIKKENTVLSNINIFNSHKINGETNMEKTFNIILEESGVPLSSGYFSKNMIKEEGIGALKINFNFIFTKKVVTNLKGRITFLPGEKLECLQIYYYDSNGLINFLREHGFKLIDSEIKGIRGQFLFEKE